jgi:hypothetical protein
MLKAIKEFFVGKPKEEPAVESAPYKVPEPAATTPIPLVVESEPPAVIPVAGLMLTSAVEAAPVAVETAPVADKPKKPAAAKKPAAPKKAPAPKKPAPKKAVK